MSEETKKAFDEAERAVWTLRRQRDVEISSARAQIMDKYMPQLAAAEHLAHEAAEAHRASEDALAAHPWEGRRVYREAEVRNSRWSRSSRIVREEAIFEVYRSWTPVPGNMSRWRLPQIGQHIVRPLKKDGTPGLKIDRVHVLKDGTVHGWKLVEEMSDDVS